MIVSTGIFLEHILTIPYVNNDVVSLRSVVKHNCNDSVNLMIHETEDC